HKKHDGRKLSALSTLNRERRNYPPPTIRGAGGEGSPSESHRVGSESRPFESWEPEVPNGEKAVGTECLPLVDFSDECIHRSGVQSRTLWPTPIPYLCPGLWSCRRGRKRALGSIRPYPCPCRQRSSRHNVLRALFRLCRPTPIPVRLARGSPS